MNINFSIKTLVEELVYLWKRRHTFKGLIGFLILINFSLVFLYSILLFVLKNANLIDSPQKFLNIIFIFIFISCIGNIFIIFIWIYWRGIPIVSEDKIGIIFAPHYDSECTDLVYRIYEQFKIDLEKRKISNEITHRLLPVNKIVKNNIEAHKVLYTTGARLIIYGYVDKGNVDDKLTEGFKQISFIIRHRNLQKSEVRPVLQNLAGAIINRTFIASEKNSFFEKDIIIENISEIACFFISMGLTLDGKVDKSIPILEHLLIKINDKIKYNPQNHNLRTFYNSITSCLQVAFLTLLAYIYQNNLIDNVTNTNYNEYAEKCSEIINKLIRLKKVSSAIYLMQAIINFHFGKTKAARDAVEEAKKITTIDDAGPYFSLAFLYLWKEDYQKALKEYIKIKNKDYNADIVLSVILFLQGLVKNHPQKIQLKFGLAYINDHFYDRVQAIKDYKSFLKNSENDKKLNILRIHAERRLKELENMPTS